MGKWGWAMGIDDRLFFYQVQQLITFIPSSYFTLRKIVRKILMMIAPNSLVDQKEGAQEEEEIEKREI